MLHRCCSSLGCPERSLEELLALADVHGLAAVELRALGSTIDLAAYLARHYGTPAALAARLARSPVRVVGLNASLKLAAPTPADRDQLLALAPWAEAAGVSWLRVFDGPVLDANGGGLAVAAETLAWWEDLRREHGWRARLSVETHDALFTGAAVQRLFAAAPGTAILWDAHHTWRKGGEDPLVTWAAIRPHVVHVHVKDSLPVPSARHPFTYVLPGDGGFPMAELRARLEADGFGGGVSLEWERMWHPYLPPLEEALRVARERAWW
jgi:sugar phosphate isomerase/epimerase